MSNPHSYGATLILLDEIADVLERYSDVRDGPDGEQLLESLSVCFENEKATSTHLEQLYEIALSDRRSKSSDGAVNALRGLHKAVTQLAEHFDKPITDENVLLWLALNSAQEHAANVLVSVGSETPPSRDDCGLIYNVVDRQWFLQPGAGTTPNRSEAYVYTRQQFDYQWGKKNSVVEFQAFPSETKRPERDYCEACGYTDSHDPNCPRPHDDKPNGDSEMEARLRNYWDQEKRRAEIFRGERDIARAQFESAVQTLTRIYSFVNPEDVTVNGKTYRFDNAAIQMEAYRALSDAIRSIPRELMAERSATPRTHPNGLWMVYYEDADARPEVFFGEGAEAAARARYDQAKMNWSCHLLSRVPSSATEGGKAGG